MRLTAELIKAAPSYINPIHERELCLRAYKIPVLENLGVTEDQYDTIDLSDNEIVKIDGFPILLKLTCLLLNNNRVTRIADGLSKYLPRLNALILTGNKLATLKDLDPLAELADLQRLSLLHNPVTRAPNYRLYVIHKLKKLKHLDFKKVKPLERKEAERLFGADDKAKGGDKAKSDKEEGKTQSAAAGVAAPAAAAGGSGGGAIALPTGELRKQIIERIQNAQSLGEIEKLDQMLQGKIQVNLN